MMAGNPIHPMTVHFPIVFILLTGFLDTLYAASIYPATKSFVTSAINTLDIQLPLQALPVLSYYTTLLALITIVPTALSGGAQLLPLISRDGFGTPKARTALAHAGLSDIAAFAIGYNWWTRRSAEGFVPTALNTGLSGALALPLILFASSLGGELVYSYGMGVGKPSGKSSGRGKKTQ